MSLIRVGRVEDLPPGRCRSVRAGTRRIAVWNVDGKFYAVEDACRHMKAPLSTGRLVGTTLTCSWHGWRYDVTTGACHDRSRGCLRTYSVTIRDGEILVGDEEGSRREPAGEGGEEDFPMPVFRK
ncbi:MAG: Rieske (2Fe-2S) protein [Acidobacteriota bacterium]